MTTTQTKRVCGDCRLKAVPQYGHVLRPIYAEGGYMLTHWPQRPQGFVMVLAVTCVAMAHLSNCQRIAP